ncbi:epsin-2-like isoform X4 [Penaeus japonicus]|uniref:epsin-2-like isoform X4 n=1 Tax=Penaeus japonicus TaxID=27405 RepID=UPI001C716EE8|nr:epsin-2-like isoform X4 [Penaeus japonicus]
MALQMNISGLRRNMKNIAHNYTDAQIKVREATSNDPWGPSSTLMSEVADLTYNVVAFSEIMQMIWKRLNDHGRNWRHVYKALVLLEYLIKTGSEKVADQCKENIFAIQTLKDFQYIEENKDQGMSVREKAKALVTLLKDDERLRNERVRALKAKERFAQSVSGIGSDSTYVTSTSRPNERNAYGVQDGPSGLEPQLEAARPQTVGEEELQLQLALAMSKEEAEQEEQRRRSDDVRLQMALTQSEEEFKDDAPPSGQVMKRSSSGQVPKRTRQNKQKEDASAMNDLLDINFNPHSGGNAGMARSTATPPVPSSLDPWGMPTSGASISPQHTSQPKSSPAAGTSPSPPPVPPFPSTSSSFFASSSPSSKITFRHSNPPLITSSSFLSKDLSPRSVTPNPFLEDQAPPFSSPNPDSSLNLPTSSALSRPVSLFLTPPPQQHTSSSLPSSYSLFPPTSTALLRPATSLSHVSSVTPDSCPLPPASYNPWGAVQVNITTAPLPPSKQTDPWGMALPNGGSETPKQNTDPWGSPASGPPSRVTSPPTTSDPWGQPPARSPEPPMGGICGNDPWAVLSSSSPAPSNSADASDPWEPVSVKAPSRDPFAPISPTNNGDVDEFSALSTRDKPANNCIGIEDGLSDAFDLSGLSSTVPDNNREKKSKSPAAFLGENSNLVNLDNLVGGTKQATPALGVSPLNSTSITSNSPLTINNNNNNLNNNNNNNSITNPFVTPGLAPSSFAGVNPFSAPSPPNPFQAQQAPKPSMNQLRTTGIGGPPLAAAPPSNAGAPGPAPGPWGSPQPSVGFGMAPSAAASQDENPFLL